MPHDFEKWCKIWRKTDFFVSKMTRIWWILLQALKVPKNFHFDCFLLFKVQNAWPKKVQKRYLLWHWRVIQNLVESKMAELNQNKCSRQPDETDAVSKLYFILEIN